MEGREEGLENAGAGFKNPEGGGRRTHLGSGLPVAYPEAYPVAYLANLKKIY